MEKLQDLGMKPCPRSDIVDSEQDIGEEVFLYDDSSGDVHTLNGGAAQIWLLCDGTPDMPSIAREIAANFELPEQEVLPKVQDTIGEFQALGLLAP